MRQTRREWARRVAAWRRSGQSAKEFAARAGVNASTLLWWSTKLRSDGVGAQAAGRPRRPGGGAQRLEPVALVELRGGVVEDRFELELGGGRHLRIPPGFDAAALERLLRVLQ
jgi:transposase